MKKTVLGVISLLSVVILVSACGGGNANNNSQQVDELQKQVEELKKQVEQNNQSNAVSQQPAQTQVQQTQPVQPIQQPYGQQNVNVSVETAKATAVSHAGLDINQVTFVNQAYDFDDGIQEWDIDFVYGTTKYEYTINAMTGAVMKYEVDSIYD